MRIVSKNRFSRVLIRKVRYNSSGTLLKQNTSIANTNQLKEIAKPAKGAELSYDYLVVAGSAL